MSDENKGKTRINRVITRSGDDGRTGLADGSRVAKDHPGSGPWAAWTSSTAPWACCAPGTWIRTWTACWKPCSS